MLLFLFFFFLCDEFFVLTSSLFLRENFAWSKLLRRVARRRIWHIKTWNISATLWEGKVTFQNNFAMVGRSSEFEQNVDIDHPAAVTIIDFKKDDNGPPQYETGFIRRMKQENAVDGLVQYYFKISFPITTSSVSAPYGMSYQAFMCAGKRYWNRRMKTH